MPLSGQRSFVESSAFMAPRTAGRHERGHVSAPKWSPQIIFWSRLQAIADGVARAEIVPGVGGAIGNGAIPKRRVHDTAIDEGQIEVLSMSVRNGNGVWPEGS